jgi:serine/threonine-protein kinase HipA
MVEKLDVWLRFTTKEAQKVGALSLVNDKIYFKYDASFLKNGWNISPFKLKFDERVQLCPKVPFDDLFGVFGDSLPDGWGGLIVDLYLISINKSPDKYTPLDRLSLVGSKGVGALTYFPEEENPIHTDFLMGLTEYAEKSLQFLSGKNAKITDEFYRLTGTSGGARPKIQVIYNTLTDELTTGNELVNEGESFWLIKFPSTHDLPDIANIEYAYYLMAKDAGLEISESKLFSGTKGKSFFGTKRFDRIGNERIHLHSVAGLLHDDFRKSTLDYGHILDAALKLEKSKKSFEKIMRLGMFNVLTANQDDHSKNFSFLMDKQGNWSFSPAYDLTYAPNIYGFQTTSVAGKNKAITQNDFESLEAYFDFQTTSNLWKEIRDVVMDWKHYAKIAGVTTNSTKRVWEVLKQSC